MNKIPNQPDRLMLEFSMFSRFTAVLALPDAALPARLLFVTDASPLAAVTLILLLIAWLVAGAISARLLRLLLLMPPPSAAAVAPFGAFIITPTHWPETFTKTSSELVPIICAPVRLKIVTLVLALPVLA